MPTTPYLKKIPSYLFRRFFGHGWVASCPAMWRVNPPSPIHERIKGAAMHVLFFPGNWGCHLGPVFLGRILKKVRESGCFLYLIFFTNSQLPRGYIFPRHFSPEIGRFMIVIGNEPKCSPWRGGGGA